MPLPRKRVLDATRAQWVHCTSRCVRRVFLCGSRYEHRKEWVQDRLRELAGLFAFEVIGCLRIAHPSQFGVDLTVTRSRLMATNAPPLVVALISYFHPHY